MVWAAGSIWARIERPLGFGWLYSGGPMDAAPAVAPLNAISMTFDGGERGFNENRVLLIFEQGEALLRSKSSKFRRVQEFE